ncbi:MAG: methyltransferase domain-containing protein [Chitinophagaceae bacterium]|nr:methyltransferase domain-containing protein [Chitinophagaceae bacterium]
MQQQLLSLLRCPVTRSKLQLDVISTNQKKFANSEQTVIEEAILYSDNAWLYPVVKGIPRLLVEAFEDYEEFLQTHLHDYDKRKSELYNRYSDFIKKVKKKNSRTKKSFTQEWNIFNYEKDRTWNEAAQNLLQGFLEETDETRESLNGKLILDAGCGHGQLTKLIAGTGAIVVGMDFSLSIERAYERNDQTGALFIQGDVQYPPLAFHQFDIVHSSGVLIATNNTELSFSCLDECVKSDGKLSVWLYHPRKNVVHNMFNFIRRFTSKLPLNFQYYLYMFILLPASYIVKRLKGNKQNVREMMIDILDWFSPEFRWEHTPDEAASWFYKRNYHSIKVTTTTLFGFNIIGIKRIEA